MTTVNEIITNSIIAKLEEGYIPWHKPWFGMPTTGNIFTGKPYGFMNQMLVEHEGGYMSLKQMNEHNVQITADCPEDLYKLTKWQKHAPTFRREEAEGYHKVTPEEWAEFSNNLKFSALSDLVVNYWQKTVEKKDKDGNVIRKEDGTPETKKLPPALRYVSVLWAGYTDHDYKLPETNIKRIEKPQALMDYYVNREGIKLKEIKGDRAFFRPATDEIQVPCLQQFKDAREFYSTCFHEMTHSSGVSKRLNRDMKGWFGDPHYAKEELVAEIGAAFLCNRCGFEASLDNTAAYIQSWLKVLNNDKNLVIEASRNAGCAADFITDGFEELPEPEPTPEPEPQATPETPTVKSVKRTGMAAAAAKLAADKKRGVSCINNGMHLYTNSYMMILSEKDLGIPETEKKITSDVSRLIPLTDNMIDMPPIKELRAAAAKVKQAGKGLTPVMFLPNGGVVDLKYITMAARSGFNTIHYITEKPYHPINCKYWNGNAYNDDCAVICPFNASKKDATVIDEKYGYIIK